MINIDAQSTIYTPISTSMDSDLELFVPDDKDSMIYKYL